MNHFVHIFLCVISFLIFFILNEAGYSCERNVLNLLQSLCVRVSNMIQKYVLLFEITVIWSTSHPQLSLKLRKNLPVLHLLTKQVLWHEFHQHCSMLLLLHAIVCGDNSSVQQVKNILIYYRFMCANIFVFICYIYLVKIWVIFDIFITYIVNKESFCIYIFQSIRICSGN